MKNIRGKAILYGYGASGTIVYSDLVDIHDYYDGMQIFDSWEQIKQAGIERLIGTVFDSDGNITTEFEQTYSVDTGRLISARDYNHREHLRENDRVKKAMAIFQERRNGSASPT